jgi:hypothetical protein
MIIVHAVAGPVAVLFAAAAAIQLATLGRARTSALLVVAASIAASTGADAFRDGRYDGTHLLGTLVAVSVAWWVYVRCHTREFVSGVR